MGFSQILPTWGKRTGKVALPSSYPPQTLCSKPRMELTQSIPEVLIPLNLNPLNKCPLWYYDVDVVTSKAPAALIL